jgi:hypothetical protein
MLIPKQTTIPALVRVKPGALDRMGIYANCKEYDFVDAIASREPGTFIPNSFGGVSGGALWRFRDVFQTNQYGLKLDREDYVLAGIAFYLALLLLLLVSAIRFRP